MVKAFDMLKDAAIGIGIAVMFGAVIAVALNGMLSQIPVAGTVQNVSATAGQNSTRDILQAGTGGLATLFSFTATQATIVAVVVIILIVGLIRFKNK